MCTALYSTCTPCDMYMLFHMSHMYMYMHMHTYVVSNIDGEALGALGVQFVAESPPRAASLKS
jgi:hypothetical protein